MKAMNEMSVSFLSTSANESFARAVVAAFASQLDPTIDQLADLKTAVSEAVTNAIVHGYSCDPDGIIAVNCEIEDGKLTIEVQDFGSGIADVQEAMRDFFTTKANDERSGLGFTIMKSFMDNLEVYSEPGEGTLVKMEKKLYA